MEKTFMRSKHTAYRILDGEAIIINFQNSLYYNFNRVGTFIWEGMEGTQSLDQIAAAVAEEYGIAPERAAEDCQEFIQSLVEEGLLE